MNKYKQQTKICPQCNLEFTNRKKWQARGLWPEKIIYCSDRCRNLGKNKSA